LPLGIPKVMVSTLASGDVRGFVGVKDITMIPTIRWIQPQVVVSMLNTQSLVFTRTSSSAIPIPTRRAWVSGRSPLRPECG